MNDILDMNTEKNDKIVHWCKILDLALEATLKLSLDVIVVAILVFFGMVAFYPYIERCRPLSNLRWSFPKANLGTEASSAARYNEPDGTQKIRSRLPLDCSI